MALIRLSNCSSCDVHWLNAITWFLNAFAACLLLVAWTESKIVLLAEDYASGVSLKKELTAFRPNNELPIEKHLDIILPISVDEFVKLEQPKELPTFLNIRLSSGNDDGFILVDSELYNNIRSLTLAPENGYQQEIEVDLTSQKDIYGYFKR